jgi:hypothetical protein
VLPLPIPKTDIDGGEEPTSILLHSGGEVCFHSLCLDEFIGAADGGAPLVVVWLASENREYAASAVYKGSGCTAMRSVRQQRRGAALKFHPIAPAENQGGSAQLGNGAS